MTQQVCKGSGYFHSCENPNDDRSKKTDFEIAYRTKQGNVGTRFICSAVFHESQKFFLFSFKGSEQMAGVLEENESKDLAENKVE